MANNAQLITNDTAAQVNYAIRRADGMLFDFIFTEDPAGTIPIDMSEVDFVLSVRAGEAGPSKILIAANAWQRPEDNVIQVNYDSFISLALGRYQYKLVAIYPYGRVQTLQEGGMTIF